MAKATSRYYKTVKILLYRGYIYTGVFLRNLNETQATFINIIILPSNSKHVVDKLNNTNACTAKGGSSPFSRGGPFS